MSRVRALFVGFMAAFAFVVGAHAADPAGSWRRPPPESDYQKPQYKELLSGWYLRGDVGYRWNGGGPSSPNVTRERYSSSYDGTVGFGYKYQWFRADLIYDRSGPTRVRATTTVATPTSPSKLACAASATPASTHSRNPASCKAA